MATITIGRVLDKDVDSVSSFEKHVLVPEEYDYIDITRTGGVITQVVYKQGGAGGTTVATLTLGYTAGLLTSVART